MALVTRLLLGAFALAFVASFLPWVRVLFITVNGTDGDGMITLATAGIGFGLVLLGERISRRRVVVAAGVTACAALTTLVYVYNLADVSHAAGESADEFFDLGVSPQFGLILGAIAAPIALLLSILKVNEELAVRKGLMPRSWSKVDLLAAGLAVTALPFALSPTLWAVSLLIAIVLASVLWFASRRSRIRTACSVLTVVGLIISSAGTVYGLIKGDDSTSLSSTLTDSLQGLPVDDLEECAELYENGSPTNDLAEPTLCLDSGVETYVFPITWECQDGRTLVSNDYGWGFRDDEWTTVGEAPFDRCNSSAEKRCVEIFVDGELTSEEWTDDYIECFDDSGDIDYVITTRWDCFDSDEVQLSNRYGWGYVGEEWFSGEEAPFC